ncbi:MAG: hypothetical protein IT270_15670, partial [Saprospiraceae bacterium]|nr:hypothetical protein [Saprospiraceae bacterium]
MKKIVLTMMMVALNVGLASAQYNFKQLLSENYEFLALAKDDTTRIKSMYAVSGTYRSINLDSAIHYAREAWLLSKKIGYQKGEINGLASMGAAHHEMGDLPKALALEFEALSRLEKHLKPCDARYIRTFITRIYTTLEDYDKAFEFARKQLVFIKTCDENSFYPNLDIAILFDKTGELDSAKYYLQRIFDDHGTEKNQHPTPYLILGNIHAKSKNNKEALLNYQKSIRIAAESENHKALSLASLQLARFYQKQNQVDSSIFYAEKSLGKAQSLAHKNTVMEAAFLLAELYEPINTERAFHYFKLASATKESLFGAGNIQAIQAMIAQEEARQKELENAKTTYQNQMRQYGLLGA